MTDEVRPVNSEQSIINHLINDHGVAPWQVWGAFEMQHTETHRRECGHAHADGDLRSEPLR